MSYIDDISKDLFSYCPPLTKRPDFDEFWGDTLRIAQEVPLNPQMQAYDYPSDYVEVYSISYNGFDDTRIHGWYIVPKYSHYEKLPCVINYHGYTANRGTPSDFMVWAAMGVAVLSLDCREQSGETGNSACYTAGSMMSVASKGLLDKKEYYYRAVYMDCVKAIDFVFLQDKIDKGRIIIHGGSQGGGIGMAVCALDSRPYLAMVDVPSNSDLQKRVEGSHGSMSSVTQYLKIHSERTEQVFDTLSYFDTMNMADNIKCKVLASVALKDDVCPARMYFATYNRIKSEKDIKIYPFNGHEGGGSPHTEVKLRFLKANL